MARSWELGSAHSPCCRLWVESESSPTRKPPRTEALQTRAFSGRRMLARENWKERAVVTRSPAAGTGSERRADTHDAGAEPSPHQLIHQRRGQRCVGPQEPGKVLVLSQVFPHRQSWRSRCQTRGLAAPAPPAPGAHPSADSRCPGAGAGRAGVGRSCSGAAARDRGAGPAGLRSGGGRGCDKGHGVGNETPALPRSAPRLPSPTAHMEPSKLPTTPGASPAVGCRKHGLFMLQMMPCSQGRVPAEGSALLGKWPEGEGGRFRGAVQDPRDPTYTPAGRWQ